MKYSFRGRALSPRLEFYHDIIPHIAGITERDFYMDAEKCAFAWETANGVLADYFGGYCAVRKPSAPPISYGHLISLGAPYTLPEDSEPNVKPFARDINEAIAIMKEAEGIDFGNNGLCRHYIELNGYLRERFPDCAINPLDGYGGEGVVTSAVLMRGQNLFIDLYDEPEKVRVFFSLLNRSVIRFYRWSNRVNGQPEVASWGAWLADDFAALIPPSLWEEFVLPYWNEYYEGRTTSPRRTLHCEGLAPEHLHYLRRAGITHFQPSVSEKLTLQNVRANTDIPFDWLLYAWKVTEMSDGAIQAWVDEAVEAGVSIIRAQIGKFAWMNGRQDRLLAFFRAFDKYRAEA